jgi:hypothetical protein
VDEFFITPLRAITTGSVIEGMMSLTGVSVSNALPDTIC